MVQAVSTQLVPSCVALLLRLELYQNMSSGPMGSFRCNGVLRVYVVRWRTLPVPALALRPIGITVNMREKNRN